MLLGNQHLPDLVPSRHVHAGSRLVQDHQPRCDQHRVGDRQLLLHASGERAGGTIDERLEAGAPEQRRGAAVELRRRHAMEAGREAEVLDHRQVSVEAERLRDVTDLALERGDVAP